jgi:hypothetical protein
MVGQIALDTMPQQLLLFGQLEIHFYSTPDLVIASQAKQSSGGTGLWIGSSP